MRWRVTAFAAVAAAVALTSPAAAGERAVVSQAGEPRLLVALERGVAPPEVAGLRRPRLVSRALNAWTATAGRSSDPTALARRVARRRGVVAAQTDAVIRRAQAGISCSGAPGTPDGYLIGAVRAGGAPLDATRPVAIVDSGIDGSLGEFSGKVVKPVNVAAGGNDVTDGDGHGTGVAGVAAARAGGMRGVAQGSPIMPVKMFGPDGSASASDLVRGIDAAVAGGAAAINVSGTGPAGDSSDAEDRVIEMAVDRAFNAGSIVVAAGGNEGTGQVDVPSAYPHVLSVAATDASDLRTSFSNFGDFVDLAAPGDAVITTAPRSLCPSGYQVASGTSFSAPAVSGAVALVDHARPALSVSQRFELVRRSARDVAAPGFDTGTGFGVLDVAKALSGPAPAGDGREVDDDVYWISGRFAKSHPALLRRTRRSARATGRVSGFNDPADVYRVELRRGDSLRARLAGAAGSRFAVGIWSPRTRGFDITDNRTNGRLLAYGDKAGAAERVSARKVARSGSYYVSVGAPHPDRGDTTYVLTLRRG